MKTNGFVITMKDYERIFQVIHSVYQQIDGSSINCQFYNVAAAYILKSVYKRNAIPVMGAAFFRLYDLSGSALAFAHINDETCSSSIEAFHCWVQLDGYLLDFTAPMYREYLEKSGHQYLIPRKMFQKNLDIMSYSHNDLKQEGDFYVQPNIELTKIQLAKVLEKPVISDLIKVCLHWFKKPPKKITSKQQIINDLGEVVIVNLSNIKLTGVW